MPTLTTDPRPAARDEVTFTAPVRWEADARAADGKLKVAGYAAVFDSESEDIGFRETLAPGCFARALSKQGSDQFLYFMHDPSAILARRSAGTLDLRETAHGLRIEAELVPTQLAQDVHTLVRTGHVSRMSFAFTVKRDQWSDHGRRRRILEIGELKEVSLVAEPAYKATSAQARSLLAAAEAAIGKRKPKASVVREPDPYADGKQSVFRDLLAVAESDARKRASIADPLLRGRDTGPQGIPAPGSTRTTVEEARVRLAALDRRDLSTTSGAGFVPANLPPSVAEKFATAARARSVLPTVLGSDPIPEGDGMTVTVPRIGSTGATVSSQSSENAAVSNTDPNTTGSSAPIAYVSGRVDEARQLFDRATPQFDQVLAAELGAALGAEVDRQLVNGSGSNGQTLGLLNVSGITSTVWTDASPTAPEFIGRVGKTYSDVATALGYGPDLVLLHPRRWAWLLAAADSSGQPLTFRLPANPSEVPGVPVNLGAGTNEDAAIVAASGELALFMDPNPEVRVIADYAGSANLTIRVEAFTRVALVTLRPVGVGKVTGTGLVTPTFP